MNKEVVIVMGYPAAGKTTLVKYYTDRGYTRLNRDTIGGTVDALAIATSHLLNEGKNEIVLDNTYPTIESRKSIIAAAKQAKATIRCVWLNTSFEDAQLNACLRMIRLTNGILGPNDFKDANNPNLFPPAVLFKYRKEFQTPKIEEGFTQVQKFPFEREWPLNHTKYALFLDFDDTLRRSVGKYKFPVTPADIKILPNRTEVLKKWQGNGYALFGVSNQSGVAKGQLTMEQADTCFKETIRQLGVTMFYKFCPHNVPPVACYCRKPHPALGAFFIETYKLRPDKCIMVGDQTTDKTFAERCGFVYTDANRFFA